MPKRWREAFSACSPMKNNASAFGREAQKFARMHDANWSALQLEAVYQKAWRSATRD
jgi:hypothetical protein